MSVRFSIDAMGGDNAPGVVVRGAARTSLYAPESRFLFFGDAARIMRLIKAFNHLKQRSEIIHTEQTIDMGMPAASALRQGRQSSMRLALDAVAQNQADCAVSAGNTGALMAMAKLSVKPVKGIKRPAIVTAVPNVRGDCVLLDLGGNISVSADMFLQFAFIGDAFARAALGLERPSIGLLNIGAEAVKGPPILHEANRLLSQHKEVLNYRGFVEGDALLVGDVDVVLTDGFTGNVALKSIEGAGRFVSGTLKRMYRSGPLVMLGGVLSYGALKRLKGRVDPRSYNGALFAGLRAPVIKSHGGTDALGFSNAMIIGLNAVRHGLVDKINDHLARMRTAESPSP